MGTEIKTGICRIVGAGEMADSVRYPFCSESDDLLIAADGGLQVILERKLKPDIVIGDFDSLGYCPHELKPIVLPCEKDDTDMLSALKQGLSRGYETFILYGGTGGREDHTIANIQLLYYLASLGKKGYLIGRQNIMTAIHNGSVQIKDGKGYLSVFSAGEKAGGVTITGCKYNLTDGVLTHLFPLGVSNEFTDVPACISVKEGTLLIITENRE